MHSRDLDYCLMRARQEAQKAATAHCPEAASIHRSLSMRYATRAVLLGTCDERPASLRERQSAVAPRTSLHA